MRDYKNKGYALCYVSERDGKLILPSARK